MILLTTIHKHNNGNKFENKKEESVGGQSVIHVEEYAY